jgi:radical SAM-linked protein
LLSHLDLVRHVPRILRRIGLRPAYSQGYNPRPRLQFAPPLPVGGEAEADLCDVWIAATGSDPAAIPQVLEALNRASLPGLEFTAARWLESGEPAVSALCAGARYRFVPAEPPDREALGARLQELLARETWEVQRMTKRKGNKKARAPQRREVRASLSALELEEMDDLVAVGFTLRPGPAGALRPRELLEAVFDEQEPRGRLVRRYHLGCEQGQEVLRLAAR